MALSPAFTINSVNTGGTVDRTAIILQDTSTGSDGAIASRQILLYTVQNALLTPAIPWPLATNPITINPLTQDIALNVLVQWLDVSGNVLYSLGQIAAFTGYGEDFAYNLIQTEESSPGILQDINYQNYVGTLNNYLVAPLRAINIGQSLKNAQNMIIKETYLVANSDVYY